MTIQIMKISKFFLSIVALMLVATSSTQSLESNNRIVYRNAQGELHEYPEGSAQELLRMARDNGHVTLWLTLNYPFNFDDLSPAEAEAQQAEINAQFAELLAPLISMGQVWEPPGGPFIRGPGATVRANKKGVKNLIRDLRLLQITHAGDAFD